MKLFSSLLIAATADDSNRQRRHDRENPGVDLGNDIVLTRCQYEFFKSKGIELDESVVTDIPCGPLQDNGGLAPSALEEGITLWTNAFNEGAQKYDVPYYFDTVFNDEAVKNIIRNKFMEFEQFTNVRMVEISNTAGWTSWIKINKDGGCSSYVGRIGGMQTLSLANNCEYGNTPLHEVMHALGWWHEQQRGDRDQHVKLWRERCSGWSDGAYNVNNGKLGEYSGEWNNDGSPYDFSSIMHYSPFACSSSEGPYMTKPDGSALELSVTSTFSFHDVNSINKAYVVEGGTTPLPPTTQPVPKPEDCCTRFTLYGKSYVNPYQGFFQQVPMTTLTGWPVWQNEKGWYLILDQGERYWNIHSQLVNNYYTTWGDGYNGISQGTLVCPSDIEIESWDSIVKLGLDEIKCYDGLPDPEPEPKPVLTCCPKFTVNGLSTAAMDGTWTQLSTVINGMPTWSNNNGYYMSLNADLRYWLINHQLVEDVWMSYGDGFNGNQYDDLACPSDVTVWLTKGVTAACVDEVTDPVTSTAASTAASTTAASTAASTTAASTAATTSSQTATDRCPTIDEMPYGFRAVGDFKNNKGDAVKFMCIKGYKMNIPYPKDPYIYSKEGTNGYCRCDTNNENCNWFFYKGNVQCTECPKETLQGRNGKKLRTTTWETGIFMYYPVKTDEESTNGWNFAFDFGAPLEFHQSGSLKFGDAPRIYQSAQQRARRDAVRNPNVSAAVMSDEELKMFLTEHKAGRKRRFADDGVFYNGGNVDLTGISRYNQLFTFTPRTEDLKADLGGKVWLIAHFDNLTAAGIEQAKKAGILYFKNPIPSGDASCLIDRFEDYPLKSA